MHPTKSAEISAFTLIEMSIVLVIIGLIIGGILLGQDLIRAAALRAQISQIEKYNSATATFRNKYGGLPGDLTPVLASQFGFINRSGGSGQGNGNGIIEDAQSLGASEGAGEDVVFWVDLSSANLIDGSFNTATEGTVPGSDISGSGIDLYFPKSRLGQGYVYVMSSAYWNGSAWANTGVNYFMTSGVSVIGCTSNFCKITSIKNLTIAQAYNIDKKVDDGLPATGQVIAWGPVSGSPGWINASPGNAQSQTTSTCYDNGGNASATMQYSLGTTTNSGTMLNCQLAFRFQE